MPYTPPHYIKSNESAEMPHEHLFFDVETSQQALSPKETSHHLRLGWLCYWRRRTPPIPDTETWKAFTTIGQFWAIVEDCLTSHQKLIMVSHNIAYDFTILEGFIRLEEMGFKLTSVYAAGITNILRFRKDTTTIQVLDNLNYFRCKLAELGQSISLEKMNVDYKTRDEALLSRYCHRDVEIMIKAWKTLYQFIEKHDLGTFAPTLPAQAMKAYRHRFMQHKILIDHQPEVTELERESYHGGRSSIFYQGTLRDGPYYKLDVNSMYPYVMRDNYYPAILQGVYEETPIARLEDWLECYSVIAKVKVNTPEPVFVKRYKGHSVYPIGCFTTTLTTPELKYALKRGYILEVLAATRYTQERLFTAYVNYFYPLKAQYRQQGNTPFATMVKYYLNTLYGKFGQKAHKWQRLEGYPKEYTENEAILNVRTGVWRRIYHFGNEAWETVEDGEARDSFPGIAAHVTAYARLYLWELIRKAGSGNCYYCDTDSLIVNLSGYEALARFIDQDKLGALKVEKVSESITLLSPKHYLIGSEWTRKGVPKAAEQTGENVWTYEQFPSLKGQAKSHDMTTLVTTKVEKTLTNTIYDGIVEKTGWIQPLQAESLENEEDIDPEIKEQIEKCQAQIDAIKQSRLLDTRTMMKLWDFSKGDWKRQRDSSGNLVPIEYSRIDSLATELGFNDLNALQQAVTKQLVMDKKQRELKRQIVSLRDGAKQQSEQEDTIPF